MNIVILSQPLLNNYGGLLQNYALQQVLLDFHHKPQTLDYLRIVRSPLKIYLFSWIKTFFLYFFPSKRRRFARLSSIGKRKKWSEDFVTKYINKTEAIKKLSCKREEQFDCIIVGSDQVWRPKYVNNIYNYFLDFLNEKKVKRIAYAASFGVDDWEYSIRQTKICSRLAKNFNAISVREESGVFLCKENLDVDATWVFDPTLLLKKEKYQEICKDIPKSKELFLAAYVLNMNDSVRNLCESIAKERGLVLKIFSADSKSSLTVPEWLAMFRDASYVITDSFHGTVFSIIFEKNFKCLSNASRGSARFESLLKMYNSGKLEEMRQFSINWLKNALET